MKEKRQRILTCEKIQVFLRPLLLYRGKDYLWNNIIKAEEKQQNNVLLNVELGRLLSVFNRLSSIRVEL